MYIICAKNESIDFNSYTKKSEFDALRDEILTVSALSGVGCSLCVSLMVFCCYKQQKRKPNAHNPSIELQSSSRMQPLKSTSIDAKYENKEMINKEVKVKERKHDVDNSDDEYKELAKKKTSFQV